MTRALLMSMLLLVRTCSMQPMDLDCPPTSPPPPSTPAISTWAPSGVVDRAHDRVHYGAVVRLAPDQLWRPRRPVSHGNLDDWLIPLDVEWPDSPAAGYLRAAAFDDPLEPVEFVDLAGAEGLLDGPPSTLDDEWDRFVALWALYISNTQDTDSFHELGEEIHASLDRSPDGPTGDALRVGLAMLYEHLGDEPPDWLEPHYLDLAKSDDPVLQLLGVERFATLPDADPGDVLALVSDLAPQLGQLRVALHLAVEQKSWIEAEDIAARVAAHPDATEPDLQDAADVLALAQAPAEQPPWVHALATEIRQCAGWLLPGPVDFVVSGGVWTPTSEGAVADCLYGWAPGIGPDEADVSVRVTR